MRPWPEELNWDKARRDGERCIRTGGGETLNGSGGAKAACEEALKAAQSELFVAEAMLRKHDLHINLSHFYIAQKRKAAAKILSIRRAVA